MCGTNGERKWRKKTDEHLKYQIERQTVLLTGIRDAIFLMLIMAAIAMIIGIISLATASKQNANMERDLDKYYESLEKLYGN